MTGSMYAAIAGLKAHMDKLSVIGNNVANINTNSYKTKRTVFRDTMYSMYSSGSNGTDRKGSTNPSQVGYGSQIGSIDMNMRGGTFSPTGNSMDCMIDGEGFFLVGDKNIAEVIDPTDPNSFKSLTLTRVGDFGFGADGYLTDGTGKPVYGLLTTGVDAEGNPIVSDQLVPIRLPRQNADGTIAWPTQTGNDAIQDADEKLPLAPLDSISIDKASGRISGNVKGTDQWITVGFLAVGNVSNSAGLTQEGDSYYKCSDGAGDLSVTLLGGIEQKLQTANGPLTYVNASMNAGGAALSDKSRFGSAGQTLLAPGGLEGSNVDLATEISEMITTQRGYQANTRIITVTDAMLEELVNMKR